MIDAIAIQTCSLADPKLAQHEAQALSQLHQLPLANSLKTPPKITLGWHRNTKDSSPKLALFQTNSGAVFIDFVTGKKAHRRHYGGGKNQPLVRAMGKIENRLPYVVDATAGMGGDSFVLASLGCHVLMLERSMAVSALLKDALLRGEAFLKTENSDSELHDIFARLQVIHTDSTHFLHHQTINHAHPIEVVYMDPMYPEKKKKAATKKEMKVLQTLVGPDQDSQHLLQAALQAARYRVVVKRPKNAPIIQLDNPKLVPTTQIFSPNTRYDIYVIKALHASGYLPLISNTRL
ncbi:MAG: class I SAM-dependent methyltransferase [Thiomicrorhabdus sp.]|nr:class I SAM-dependent methyltransferase [Thiomicrorhabdus sp.]